MYGSETVLWKENERSRIRAVQDNLRGLLVLNQRVRKLWGVMKGVVERIDEGVLWWFGHVENGGLFKEKRFGCQASKENGAG